MSNPFTDKAARPTDATLRAALGRTMRHWNAVVSRVTHAHDGVTTEWKYYAGKYGWTFKLLEKRRAVLWMSPRQGKFLVSMALREPAVAALRETRLPIALIEEIETAKPFPEGRPARIDVTNLKHVASVVQLAELKLTT